MELETIINKLKELDFDLTPEQKALLKIDDELIDKIIEEMKKNKSLKEKIIEDIMFGTGEFGYKSQIKIVSSFDQEVTLFPMEKKLIDKGIFCIGRATKNWDKLEEKIKDKEYKIENISFDKDDERLNEKFLNILLENKRYDIIHETINDLSTSEVRISESFFLKLLNEYPTNNPPLNINKIMLKDIDKKIEDKQVIHEEKFIEIYKKNIKKFPLDYILKNGPYEGQTKKEWLEIIKEKINNPKENIDIELEKNEYAHNAVNIIRLLEREDRSPMVKKSLEKESVSFLLSQNYDFDDETITKICEILKKKNITNLFHFLETTQLNNKEFANTLMQLGYDEFAKYCKYYDEEKSVQTIIKLIQDNNYDKIMLNKTTINNKKLQDAIIEKIEQDNNLDVLKILPNDIQKNTKQELYTKAVCKLIKDEKYNCIMRLLEDWIVRINLSSIEDENKDLKEKIKNNLFLAYTLFQKYEHKMILVEEYIDIYINMHGYFTNEILAYIREKDELEYLYNEKLFNQVKKYLIKKHNLDPGHLEIIKDKFGPTVIKYIENEKIQELINLEYDKFKKLIELFPQQKYNMQDLEAIYDSFKQEEFIKTNPEIKNIFPNIKKMIQQKNERYINEINKLKETWNEKVKNKIIEKYPEQKEIIENEDYIEYVTNKIKTTKELEQEKYIEIIHIMTDNYIAEKREQYRKTYDIINELKIKKTYEEKDVIKEIIKLLLKTDEQFKEKVIKELETTLDNSLIQEIIDFYITKNLEKYKDRSDVKKNTNKLLTAAQKILTKEQIKNYKELAINQATGLKEKYELSGKTSNIYKILSNVRVEILETKLLDKDHEEEYNILKSIIKKHKLDCLPEETQTLLSKDIFELNCNINDIATFISFFYDIEKKQKKKEMQITKIFEYIEKYSAVSSVYSQILGKEDASIIKQDPAPHSSNNMTKEQRLKLAVQKTMENFKITSIKIPTFIEEVKTTTEKTITAIVGNFTKSTNLTHGERTSACMRIGGAGEKLLYSKEAFHIEFNEPETEKYISRVTGFRNGNTVFLNELRNTCDEELYTDLDLIEACKNVASLLIEKSKTSESPIENVVIHRSCAMESVEDDRVTLDIYDIKQGLKNFYTDVTSFVHVLKTTEEPFKSVDLDNSKIPNYKPVRERIKRGNTEKILEQINRVHAIKETLETNDYKNVAPINETIVYGITGEDFYVYINNKNEIKSELIERDIRALEEYDKAIEEMNNILKEERHEK